MKLVCTVPRQDAVQGGDRADAAIAVEGNEIVFEPLPKLAPRADAIYRVTVKCTAPGIAHFKAADHQRHPDRAGDQGRGDADLRGLILSPESSGLSRSK